MNQFFNNLYFKLLFWGYNNENQNLHLMYGNAKNAIKVGIDDMAVYLPKLFLPIETLAEARKIEYAKLNKGLGLSNMSVADVHEDAATMAANAVLELIVKNNINPVHIGRIYLGTESALDGAKPTATYIQEMLTMALQDQYGPDCLLNCDVVDLTFACIGAVDAMQNITEWASMDQNRMGIVVASDIAKYELGSTGEYTQGAGAVAMLIKQNPRLIAFDPQWGVASKPVHDFFKPLRTISKEAVINQVLELAGIEHVTAEMILAKQNGHLDEKGLIDIQESYITYHKETPVFDGPYSNDCYQERIKEALQHYACQKGVEDNLAITAGWERMIFHLPYAYQARRMFSEIFVLELKKAGKFQAFLDRNELEEPVLNTFETEKDWQKANRYFLKAVSKSIAYRNFVAEKIEKGERASSHVGNLYTGSIFLALMSTLEADLEDNNEMAGTQIGFFAYGSGSKSKVFTGTVQERWTETVNGFHLSKKLQERQSLDYLNYEKLHRKKLTSSIIMPQEGFALEEIRKEKDNAQGARTYTLKANIWVKA